MQPAASIPPSTDTAPVTGGKRLLPRPSVADILAVNRDVLAPNIAKGVIHRRRFVMSLAERFDFDGRAVRRMQALRRRYGSGPLLMQTPPGRTQALILSPDHVRRVLDGTPEPFAVDSWEKKSALSHFQPRGVLISHGAEREDRRRFNAEVLEERRPVHSLARRVFQVIDEEAGRLLLLAWPRGWFDWDEFAQAWFRMVRRVVLGDAARDDHALADAIVRLRSAGNWAFLHPKRTALLRWFHGRLTEYLARPQPGTLCDVISHTASTESTAPTDQMAHWLFALDPTGMTTYRTMALLATHPDQARRAHDEINARAETGSFELPFLRACVLESLRLWPTTPVILRETTEETSWESGLMPAGVSVVIFAPYFQRDDERLSFAHDFVPDLWLGGDLEDKLPLVPFSAGPAICPGRQLMLLLSTGMLASVMQGHRLALGESWRLQPDRPMPGSLDHYSMTFRIS